MYSKEASDAIIRAGAAVGDRISITSQSGKFEGLLMPRIEAGDPDCITIKLDSGYNIGVSCHGSQISLLSKAAQKEEKAGAARTSTLIGRHASHISLLSCGGTIASRVDYKTGAVSPSLGAQELAAAYPRLSAAAPISVRTIFSILSEDMRPSYWEALSEQVAAEFADGAAGVVIAHGTDTMGYSAAALSYALQNLPGPVVFTGSQRSSDRGSTDAAQNLYCSCMAARADFAAVAICMHETLSDTFNALHIGTRVRKAHTSSRSAFRSIGLKPMARIGAENGQFTSIWERLPKKGAEKISLRGKFSGNVHLAWSYPGINAKTVEKWADYDGVVIAGTGLGHVPLEGGDAFSKHSLLKPLEELITSGVPVAMAPQTLAGRVHLQVYSTGRHLARIGVIGHGADWLPETAYVKMCWALGQTKDAREVRKIMETPTSYDILPRSPIESSE